MKDSPAIPKRARAGRAPAQRPAQILDAAARVFLRDGLDATIDAIAAEAGLGKGTVYEYFASKAQILTALRARYTDQTVDAGRRSSSEPDAPAIDRVRRFIGGMFAFGMANARLVSLLFHEAGGGEDDQLGPIRAELLALVEEGARSGRLAVTNVEFSVDFILHGLHGMMETSLARGYDTAQVIDRADDILVAILKPLPPPPAG
ncbi:TetR/AcrR family transcriptional regulator [Actinomadura sp. HBU206391]|uniref:TetR/AcrR family transcriptional regulator n=1 Tax=Actinomadura sp. HBU206391 TaxID=2731692 RepID=UPI0016502C94|nr:TetR/AcrR family transcriptional regulator [Actinomadura sp. HBU206391]MBC6457831.1 TetR/AcrR family transcriptional regulator [Actinomadura sp. HBU206391]